LCTRSPNGTSWPDCPRITFGTRCAYIALRTLRTNSACRSSGASITFRPLHALRPGCASVTFRAGWPNCASSALRAYGPGITLWASRPLRANCTCCTCISPRALRSSSPRCAVVAGCSILASRAGITLGALRTGHGLRLAHFIERLLGVT
jgi:hypothetical protein